MTLKFCCCCNKPAHSRLQRVCRSCGVPAIWRQATPAEIAAKEARTARTLALIEELAAGRFAVEAR